MMIILINIKDIFFIKVICYFITSTTYYSFERFINCFNIIIHHCLNVHVLQPEEMKGHETYG